MLTWDNTMLPQEQTFVCLEKNQAWPKSQFQNPSAQTTKRIGELNFSPLIWLNHLCNYDAPPHWSYHNAYLVQVQLAQKGMSLTSTLRRLMSFLIFPTFCTFMTTSHSSITYHKPLHN
jgi:hypothetical protein